MNDDTIQVYIIGVIIHSENFAKTLYESAKFSLS